MISATGSNKIRNDKWGHGGYGTPRNRRDGSKYQHRGVDYECVPGNDARAPIAGIVDRFVQCYSDTDYYTGLILRGVNCSVKLLYIKPNIDLAIGQLVNQGEIVGICQDISKRYDSDMTPHVHQEIIQINPDIFVSQL